MGTAYQLTVTAEEDIHKNLLYGKELVGRAKNILELLDL